MKEIRDIVTSHKLVYGIHDLIVHDYGPGRLMISLHAEVDAEGDIQEIHEQIDHIEHELQEKLHCSATIHMDPIVTDDKGNTGYAGKGENSCEDNRRIFQYA